MGDISQSNKESEDSRSEQEYVKVLKRQLENWREILLYIDSLLMWEKSFYPGILASIITLVFGILWYFEPSVLTTFSVLGIIVCILDYVVPLLSANFFDSSKWTGVQEQKYEEICKNLAVLRLQVKETWNSTNKLKETKPKMYFLGVLGILILTAWIGNMVDNLFLIYVAVLTVGLLPGLKQHGIVQHYAAEATTMIQNMIAQKKKKKT